MKKEHVMGIIVAAVVVAIVLLYFEGISAKQGDLQFAPNNGTLIPLYELCTNSTACSVSKLTECSATISDNIRCVEQLAPNQEISRNCTGFIRKFEEYKQTRESTNEILRGVESVLYKNNIDIQLTKMQNTTVDSLAALGLCFNAIGKQQGTLNQQN